MPDTTLQLLLGLFFGTFVSEDAACATGGLLASQGRLSLGAAITACGLGILASDLALVALGRAMARGASARRLRWCLPSETKIVEARRWFARRGAWVVIASRFVPGTRCATCLAAGFLRAPLGRFIGVFALASALWTPLAVGAVYFAGGAFPEATRGSPGQLALAVLIAIVGLALVSRLIAAVATRRGRRLLGARWHRLTHFEFWPWWVFYAPVVAYIALRLVPRHRSVGVFTAANPAIPAGGLRGESKSAILAGLGENGGRIARWTLLSSASPSATGAAIGAPTLGSSTLSASVAARLEQLETWMRAHALDWPVVLKPDMGERGLGVAIVRSAAAAKAYLENENAPGPTIAQAYIEGKEFGVFYARRPGEARGRVLSITGKHLPRVTGDGVHTLERLILDDDRAVLMATFFFAKFRDRLAEIPAAGESVLLADLGNHCRGAVFLDFTWALTPQLEQAIDELACGFPEFYFGRFDLRAPSLADLRAGRGIKVLELNGVTSEQGHIYDPNHLNVWEAWGTMFAQWRLAYEIGAANARRGAPALGARALLRLGLGREPAQATPSAPGSTRSPPAPRCYTRVRGPERSAASDIPKL